MLYLLAWMTGLAMGLLLGYVVGCDVGYRRGNQRGYCHALRQALFIERPMYQLCRVLVPSDVERRDYRP